MFIEKIKSIQHEISLFNWDFITIVSLQGDGELIRPLNAQRGGLGALGEVFLVRFFIFD
jgi:hypothetical protein